MVWNFKTKFYTFILRSQVRFRTELWLTSTTTKLDTTCAHAVRPTIYKVWASVNKLLLNHLKTREIVFKRPRALHCHMPPALEEIEQLRCVKLLGMLFQDNFKTDSHVQYILSQCVQRMYLLKLLQHQGLPLNKSRVLVYSLIVSRIGYALSAWGGFVSVEICCKIDAMFKRLKRYMYGYTTDYLTFSDKADSDLFCNMRQSYHCLHHVLPPLRTVPKSSWSPL